MSLRALLASALSLSLLALLLPLDVGCQATCGSSADCGDDEYCSIASGACLTGKSVGFCKPRPTACTEVLKPVCGCDGKTYDNACEATKQGTALAGDGACGTGCSSNEQCGQGEYCELAQGACGQAAPTGTCKAPPDACPEISSPVCGCDGKTYGNGCLAAQAQVSVLSAGECACGGPANVPCEAGRYCELAQGACLGPNAAGQCKVVPTACTTVQSPVCGCDGKTYGNACEAAKMQQNVAAANACVP
jgi:hypothetical protein